MRCGLLGHFVLENQARNLFDATEIFYLEILNGNLRVECLLEAKQELHKLLLIKDSCIQQVRRGRWHIDVKVVNKQLSDSIPYVQIFSVQHGRSLRGTRGRTYLRQNGLRV